MVAELRILYVKMGYKVETCDTVVKDYPEEGVQFLIMITKEECRSWVIKWSCFISEPHVKLLNIMG